MKYIAISILLAGIASCSEINRRRTIIIKGSETLMPLMDALSQKYNFIQSVELKFKIEGGGSQSGLEALLKGEADIAMSSKPFNPSEFDPNLIKNKKIQKLDIALDEIIAVVNTKNKVTRLTSEQLRAIYAGKIRTWDKVGGSKDSIVVLTRKEGSGTLSYFKENVMLGQDFAASVIALDNVKDMISKVELDTNAIAYMGGVHLSKSLKVLDISTNGEEYFYPSVRNVRSKNYPYVIPLYLYYIEDDESLKISNFISYSGSKSAGFTITDFGFIPTNPE